MAKMESTEHMGVETARAKMAAMGGIVNPEAEATAAMAAIPPQVKVEMAGTEEMRTNRPSQSVPQPPPQFSPLERVKERHLGEH